MQSQMEVDEEDLYIHYRLTARGKEQQEKQTKEQMLEKCRFKKLKV